MVNWRTRSSGRSAAARRACRACRVVSYIYIYIYIHIYILFLCVYTHLYIYTCTIMYVSCRIRSVFKMSRLFLRPRPWQFEIWDSTDKSATYLFLGFETLNLKFRDLKLCKLTATRLFRGVNIAFFRLAIQAGLSRMSRAIRITRRTNCTFFAWLIMQAIRGVTRLLCRLFRQRWMTKLNIFLWTKSSAADCGNG